MVNAYIIDPKSLVLKVNTSETLFPLSVSASQINEKTGNPIGIIAIDGTAYIGGADDFPVFVRYKDGTSDILNKANTHSIAYSDFAISGVAVIVSENKPRNTARGMYVRPLDRIKRVAIGLLEDGNVLLVVCNSALDELKELLCSYGVCVGMLVASGNIYINNPINKVAYGERPIVTLNATTYDDFPTPIIVIDPAHGGVDTGNRSKFHNEKDLTLEIAKVMCSYLRSKYYGTFILTRTDDCYITDTSKAKFIQSVHADFMYECHINSYNSVTRGAEFLYYEGATSSTKKLVDSLYLNLRTLLQQQGIKDTGLTPVNRNRFKKYTCPTFAAKTLYIDNAEDSHLLSKPHMLRMLGEVQGEALAKALGLSPCVFTPSVSKNTKEHTYKVITGSFKFKLGATERCEELRNLGFDSYIEIED